MFVQSNDVFLRHHFCNFTSTLRNIYTTCVFTFLLQYVNLEECYLCGYLKIKGLTEEYPTLTTFFDGEIISKKYPFLTRKWEADEDVDKKHWVRIIVSNNFPKKHVHKTRTQTLDLCVTSRCNV